MGDESSLTEEIRPFSASRGGDGQRTKTRRKALLYYFSKSPASLSYIVGRYRSYSHPPYEKTKTFSSLENKGKRAVGFRPRKKR